MSCSAHPCCSPTIAETHTSPPPMAASFWCCFRSATHPLPLPSRSSPTGRPPCISKGPRHRGLVPPFELVPSLQVVYVWHASVHTDQGQWTVSTAGLLVAPPIELPTWIVNTAPLSAALVAGVV